MAQRAAAAEGIKAFVSDMGDQAPRQVEQSDLPVNGQATEEQQTPLDAD